MARGLARPIDPIVRALERRARVVGLTEGGARSYKPQSLAEQPRTLQQGPSEAQRLDARVETLARQIAEVINGAGEQRQSLRESALGLIKEETEVIEAPGASTARKGSADTNPLGMALLLGAMAIPMGILFFPVGLTMFAIALVLGVVGVVGTLIRR